jgi:hypothetical protein
MHLLFPVNLLIKRTGLSSDEFRIGIALEHRALSEAE